MYEELKQSLKNLGKDLQKDTDVVALKAVCESDRNYGVEETIKEIIQRLKEKYPDIKEICNLGVEEDISVEELLKVLNTRYITDSETIILKALAKSLHKNATTDMAICESIERLQKQNPEDELLKKFVFENSWMKDVKLRYYNDNMIYVNGNKEVSSFFGGKYEVTNGEWDKIMEKNMSIVPGNNKPVNGVPRKFIYEYCNELSKRHGLQPAYKLENGEVVGIIYANGDIKNPQEADFRKTEGYRLPTNEVWELMAINEDKAMDEGIEEKNNCDFSISNEYAWYNEEEIKNVGLKKPNSLGFYDILGNVAEMIFTKNEKSGDGIARGGHYKSTSGLYRDLVKMITRDSKIESIGFRVVRTFRISELINTVFNNWDGGIIFGGSRKIKNGMTKEEDRKNLEEEDKENFEESCIINEDLEEDNTQMNETVNGVGLLDEMITSVARILGAEGEQENKENPNDTEAKDFKNYESYCKYLEGIELDKENLGSEEDIPVDDTEVKDFKNYESYSKYLEGIESDIEDLKK